VKIDQAVRLGRRIEKNRLGQDSQKKSQGGNISPIWGEAHCTDWNQNLHGG